MKFIDSDAEYHKVLFELGLLDDDDDWDLFHLMESDLEDIDLETYKKYVKN